MKYQRGFSLAEVLVSMLMVTTGLLALGHTLAKSVEGNYRTNQEAQAIAFALQKAESLRTVALSHADLTDGTHTDTPATGFTRSWVVTTVGGTKNVTLTLTRAIPKQTQPVRVVLGIQRVQ